MFFFIDRSLKTGDRGTFLLLCAVIGGALAASLVAGFFRDFLLRVCAADPSPESGRECSGVCRISPCSFTPRLTVARCCHVFPPTCQRWKMPLPSHLLGYLPYVTGLIATGLMLWLNWKVGLIGVVLWPWAILAPRAISPRSARATYESDKHETSVLGVVEESLSAQAVIRAFAIEHLGAAASAPVMKLYPQFHESRFAGSFCGTFYRRRNPDRTGLRLSPQLVACLDEGDEHRRVGRDANARRFAWHRLLYLVEYLPVLVGAQGAFEGIQESMRESSAVTDASDARILPAFDSEIVFSGVSHQQPDASCLPTGIKRSNNVSLRIPKGKLCGLRGCQWCG